MDKNEFDLLSSTVPFQMHDEQINRIELTDKCLRLHFDSLHFDSKHTRATIDFTGMEDVTCCGHMDVYDVHYSEILGGTRYFADEFEALFEKESMALIVVDMWIGYEGQIMITGKVLENDFIGDKMFSLYIEATSMIYKFD